MLDYPVKPGNDDYGGGQPVAPVKKRGKDQPVLISIPIAIWMGLMILWVEPGWGYFLTVNPSPLKKIAFSQRNPNLSSSTSLLRIFSTVSGSMS